MGKAPDYTLECSTRDVIIFCSYSFGFKPDVHTPVAYMDDSRCLYVCGHTIICLDADTKQQKSIECSIGAIGVSALAVASDKR